MKSIYVVILSIITLSFCTSCTEKESISTAEIIERSHVEYNPKYACGFDILVDDNEVVTIRISQPWQGVTNDDEQHLVIFPDSESAEGYDGQHIVGPAERIVCMSTSHIAMLDALGEVESVVGVSGKDYVTNSVVTSNPKVLDVGYDANLDFETLSILNPDIVLMYGVTAENSAITAKLRELEIPYLYLGDYVEESPLGKAEWLVCVAEIIGCRERGIRLFEDIEQRYNSVKSHVADGDNAPKVMFNLPYQDVWYMPSDDSYMVRLVEDAGGEYIYKGINPTGGSKGISLEEAYGLVSRADIWLNVGQCKNMEELIASVPNFAECDVVERGVVYNNNLRLSKAGGSDFWESAIVHPDVVLADLVSIMSGEPRELYYFRSLGNDVMSKTLTQSAISNIDTPSSGKRTTSHSALWGIVLLIILALCVAYAIRSYFERGALRHAMLFTLLAVAMVCLAIGDLLIGSSTIPISEVWVALTGGETSAEYLIIINKLRLPKVIVAIVAGMALAASGLQMQTLFRNPLAGPYVLGINAGASLGVALFTLALPLLGGVAGGLFARMGITAMAWIGAAAILLMMMAVSRKIGNISVILILGMMLGSAISAVVGILQYIGTEESLKSFVVWTMGSLSTVTLDDLYILVPVVAVGLGLSFVAIKSLNMLLLGEGYARTVGLNVRFSRGVIFLATTLLAATVTAYCGPIGFIGLAMPHLARMTFRTADHRVLMPASMLWGGVAMLLCCILCDIVAHSGIMLPINTITSLLGIPIIIVVIIRNRNRQ